METNLFTPETRSAMEPVIIARHVITIVALAVIAHFLVRLVQFISDWFIKRSHASRIPRGFGLHQSKLITFTGLLTSAVAFLIYFIAAGLVVRELGGGRYLATYLATASVIGLAVAFGSQGLVQDVVTGLTLIFSNALDVGDVIEVSGQVGRVQRVGLRFTMLVNLQNQQVFVPNRMIASIGRYPQGGVSVFADVQMPASGDPHQVVDNIQRIAHGTWRQFGAILLAEPELSEIQRIDPGAWAFVRIHFRIWPGQGALIETTFRQRLVATMKALDPNYADWMVTVTYRATLPQPSRSGYVI